MKVSIALKLLSHAVASALRYMVEKYDLGRNFRR